MEKSLEEIIRKKFKEYGEKYLDFINSDLPTKYDMKFSMIMKPHELVMEDIERDRLRNTNPTDK